MTNLRFITDEELRNMIERDKKELASCMQYGLCKSALILSGSIIEAVLADYYLAFPRANTSPHQVLTSNLSTLIDWAQHDKLISQRTREISTVIRHYRNLIHPGREYRVQERPDVHSATVASSLVEIILQEISENYADQLGYTAEQAISKVKVDPSCISIFDDMIERMSGIERVKLFKAIPRLCSEDVDNIPNTVMDSFIELHRLLKPKIQIETIKNEIESLYERMHNSSKYEIIFLCRFYADDLDNIEEIKRKTLIKYLIDILCKGDESELSTLKGWRIYRKFGKYLNNQEGAKSLSGIMYERDWIPEISGDNDFIAIVNDIYISLDTQLKTQIISDLKEGEWRDRIGSWKTYLEEDLPV